MIRLLSPFVLAAALAVVGCSDSKTPPGSKPVVAPVGFPTMPVMADSLERRVADHLAWKKRATKVLDAITDESSAMAMTPHLKTLIDELEQIYARGRAQKTISPEEKAAVQAKFGADLEQTDKRYVAALKQFERQTQKKHIADAVRKRTGISITHMKVFKKD